VTNSYLKRSSMTSELDPLTQKWHLYILQPPREEEVNIAVSVLWFPVERFWLGQSISTFGIRSSTGEAITAFPDSDIFRVQPRVQMVAELLTHTHCPKWVLPVTTESAICSRYESQGSYIHTINRSFCRLMQDSMDSVLKPSSLHKLVHVNSSASEMSVESPQTPHEDAEQAALFALTQALPGSRTATVGNIYAHLGDHSDTFTSGLLVSFHAMLSAAVAAGRSRDSLKRLFDETAEHIRGGKAFQETNKRAKSPLATGAPDDTGSTSNVTSYIQDGETVNAHETVNGMATNRTMETQLHGTGMCKVGEEVLLSKRFNVEGAEQLLRLLVPIDPELSNIKMSALSTTLTKKYPKGCQWLHFLMEVLDLSPILKNTPHKCGSESPAAKKPPGFFTVIGGQYKVVTLSDFVSKPTSTNQLAFWFSAKSEGLPFGCTIFSASSPKLPIPFIQTHPPP
tara:strand:+ start:93 stop:1454 length:1362 start_codon:yes stop_codon:yes gene_type:complete